MAIDITSGVFTSGKRYVSFGEAGAAAGDAQQLVSKDYTNGGQHFQLYGIWLSCGTGGNVAIYDGSSKVEPIVRLRGDPSVGSKVQTWDWRDDPLDCTADGTSLCICAAGTFDGFVKYGWGS